MRTLVLPIIVPMGTAAIMLLTRRLPALQRWLGLAGAFALLANAAVVFGRVNSAGIQVLQIGGWPAPFGITLVADHLSAVMVLITGIMGFGVGLYSLRDVDENRERNGFHPL